ncbi:ankyrin repeat-containing protein [Hibiscus syriacus]|uniref:Ankyrin repeat-containing protein n=1 Tax=Hibiscus syriacus TaxID=106335 RepID=A0A6A2ZF77_HIBSY|nr:probable membrane-associated kinase regulator 3 [Hibiscus syriacus]KAE8689762.1 ankyrin repeat-containing protein [Hibiscus syriacus]
MMAISQESSSNHADEDYIDKEISSPSNYLCYSISSPPQSREFEFQMCLISPDGEFSSTNPADELFYKGKLLPLHLPPRLQMVQSLTQSSDDAASECKTRIPLEENSSFSPSESCRVSCELNADDYLFECSTENGFIGNGLVSKASWSRKLKQSAISQKLKASRAYLKSLFSKSGCSDESCAKAACNVEAGNGSKNNDCVNKYMKLAKKNPFGKIDNDRYKISSIIRKSIDKELAEDAANSHRRSFSGVIQRHSTIISSSSSTSTSTSTSSSNSSSSSSSFSFSSSGFHDLRLLKRSNSANSEIENSIQGAIAHCKQSQQLSSSRKTATELGVCSLSASKISVSGDQEKQRLCRI